MNFVGLVRRRLRGGWGFLAKPALMALRSGVPLPKLLRRKYSGRWQTQENPCRLGRGFVQKQELRVANAATRGAPMPACDDPSVRPLLSKLASWPHLRGQTTWLAPGGCWVAEAFHPRFTATAKSSRRNFQALVPFLSGDNRILSPFGLERIYRK